ncbi:MAG: putative porin [Enterobacterales bacterium]|nr:putative porin [Enterobacterales bacterium]
MFGGQILNEFKLSNNGKLIAGIGYYDYLGVQGYATLFDAKPRGNTLNANGNYLNDYNIVETFAEYKTKMSDQPVSVFVNYFKNTAAQTLDTSYVVGVKLGKVKAAGSWDIGLNYQDTEADAVIGLFNDSDFAGGHTDSKGFTLKAGYGIRKNVKIGLAYINSEFGQSLPVQTKYNRLQLDFKVKFK